MEFIERIFPENIDVMGLSTKLIVNVFVFLQMQLLNIFCTLTVINIVAVSYTHLDVYKRQLIRYALILPNYTLFLKEDKVTNIYHILHYIDLFAY